MGVIGLDEFITAVILNRGQGGGGGTAQLKTPSISLLGNTVTITDGDNGAFAGGYDVYLDGTKVTTVPYAKIKSFTLSDITYSESGTFDLTVKTVGNDMDDSDASNAISISVQIFITSDNENFIVVSSKQFIVQGE